MYVSHQGDFRRAEPHGLPGLFVTQHCGHVRAVNMDERSTAIKAGDPSMFPVARRRQARPARGRAIDELSIEKLAAMEGPAM